MDFYKSIKKVCQALGHGWATVAPEEIVDGDDPRAVITAMLAAESEYNTKCEMGMGSNRALAWIFNTAKWRFEYSTPGGRGQFQIATEGDNMVVTVTLRSRQFGDQVTEVAYDRVGARSLYGIVGVTSSLHSEGVSDELLRKAAEIGLHELVRGWELSEAILLAINTPTAA